MLVLFPSGHSDLGGVTSPEPGWLLQAGWSVLGLRELGACGRQGASTVNLECRLPFAEPPTFRNKWEKLRVWN